MDPRKQPFKEKLIKNLKKDDFKVALSGFVVSKKDGAFILDDSTGEVIVISPEAIKEDYVKVFGIVIPHDDGFQIQADIVKPYNNSDKDILKKVKELLE